MKKLNTTLNNYRQKALSRKESNLPAKPLTVEEIDNLIAGLKLTNLENKYYTVFTKERIDKLIIRLLSQEVKRGSFPSSFAKARGLSQIVKGKIITKYLSAKKALYMLADMQGGAAVEELIDILQYDIFNKEIIDILKETVLINKKEFDKITLLAGDSKSIQSIITSWAGRTFAANWKLQDSYKGITIKVGDHVTTGHLSPSNRAGSRTDHPLHAQYIMEGRKDEADFLLRWENLKKKEKNIILVAGKSLGEGSSRKSATFTMLQILGKPVTGEPEKKAGGIVIAESIAPIFKESLIASGIIPIISDTSCIKEGDKLTINLVGRHLLVNGKEEINIELPPQYKLDKIAAGGMKFFDAGNELQKWAISFCQKHNIELDERKKRLTDVNFNAQKPLQTLAQKIVGMNRIDGKKTIVPGETAAIKVRGVFSQDTTGPMTINEYQAMAGGDFGADFVVQSLCHTGECPSTKERDTHKFIYNFITERGGICLKSGEGIIHTIGNRFVLPTDVIVGGDSHTRTQRGISFPAASDIVAGVMKYGKLNLTMDESVKVVFEGQAKEGITARDLVSTLVVYAEKTAGKEIYNGRIIEIEGVEFLTSDERYILTNSVAERNASAGIISPDNTTLQAIKENLQYLKSRQDANKSQSVENAIEAITNYLENPVLPEADANADYAAIIKIPLANVDEPLIAKPHHPDNVVKISEVSGTKIDEVFIGSCVGGDLKSIQEAAKIIEGHKVASGVNFVISPASRDIYTKLVEDNSLAILTAAGATVIMAGCGLCMGNKRRIGSGATAFTTTTRNYQSRIGPEDSRTYLGSAHIAAMAAVLGEIPTKEKYFEMFK